MCPCIYITIIISLVINLILGYLFRNSHEYSGEPAQMTLIAWIACSITTFIPALNIVASIVFLVVLCSFYAERDLKLNEDFWLAKKY